MTIDAYTKALLTVIAACVVLLVAQGFGLVRGGSPESAATWDTHGRYRLIHIPRAQTLVRIDTDTGETWKLPIVGVAGWIPIGDQEEGAVPEPPDEPQPKPEEGEPAS